MDPRVKAGLGVAGLWAGLYAATKAAQPALASAAPNPTRKPSSLPLPVAKKPAPADGTDAVGPIPLNNQLRELSLADKARAYRLLQGHGLIDTSSNKTFLVDPSLGASSGATSFIDNANQASDVVAMLKVDDGGAWLWFASNANLAPLSVDPDNRWVVFLRPGEVGAVRMAALTLPVSDGNVVSNLKTLLAYS